MTVDRAPLTVPPTRCASSCTVSGEEPIRSGAACGEPVGRVILCTRGGRLEACVDMRGSRPARAPHLCITDTHWSSSALSTEKTDEPRHHCADPRLRVTPRSWEHWKAHYEQQGYRVRPGLPRFRGRGRGSECRPDPVSWPTVPAVIDHLTNVIGGLERPPILMGHSAAGDSPSSCWIAAYGAVGVRFHSAPTEGVPVVPLSQLKSTFPGRRGWFGARRLPASPSSNGATRSPTPSPRSSSR